jgi:hypothetical protein
MRTACNSTTLFVVTAVRAHDVTWLGSSDQPVSQRRCHSADHGRSVTGRSLVFWMLCLRSQGSSVGIATKLGVGRPGFDPGQGQEILCSPYRSDWLWGTPSHLPNRYRGTQPSAQLVPRNPAICPIGTAEPSHLPNWYRGIYSQR